MQQGRIAVTIFSFFAFFAVGIANLVFGVCVAEPQNYLVEILNDSADYCLIIFR